MIAAGTHLGSYELLAKIGTGACIVGASFHHTHLKRGDEGIS
jgi:hypothetical protein